MKTYDKKRIAEYVTLLFAVGLILFVSLNTDEAKKLLNYVLVILNPFIYGFCIAFILNLVSKQIDKLFKKHDEKKGREFNPKKHRGLSIFLSLLVFLLFAGLTIGMIIPNLKSTAISLYNQAPKLWDSFMKQLDIFKTKQPKLAPYISVFEENLDSYYDKAVTSLKSNISNIISTALTKVKSASNVLLNLGLGFIIAFGALSKKEELVKEMYAILKKLLPGKAYTRVRYVLKLANKKFLIYFKYNLIQALITGAVTFLVMLVSGMPYKISISLLITVTQLIPIVGAIAGTTVSALLIAAVSPIKAVIFVILCILVQQAVEKLINPHLMGKELEMPGVLTFLAIVIGGKQFGLIGLICSVPFVSIFYDIYTLKLRPIIYAKKKEIKENYEITD